MCGFGFGSGFGFIVASVFGSGFGLGPINKQNLCRLHMCVGSKLKKFDLRSLQLENDDLPSLTVLQSGDIKIRMQYLNSFVASQN